ncbi:amidohydrolase family protein [Tahibacter caeni]|uniref:amidohydrolase family protein n=1 Tax=Tahibacter caeni TaxID=1453545 RepID=UPI002147FE5E|nr:amidohydrolase family protein [Tahibacter caeni]
MKTRFLVAAVVALGGCAPLTRHVVRAPDQRLFDGGGYRIERCDASYVGVFADCTLSGSGPRQVLRANLISGDRLYLGGSLTIGPDGRIEAAGCAVPDIADAVVLDCPGALVSAGFINLHEHIDYSYQQPAQPPVHRWKHRNEWRRLHAAERGFEGDAPADAGVRADVSERAMLRHALSGTTSLSGAKEFRAFVRNLGLAEAPLGTPAGLPIADSTFPLDDGASMEKLAASCTAAEAGAVHADPERPFLAHVGEGTDASARYEVDCLLRAVAGKSTPNAFIHGVAISSRQIPQLARQDVAVVLSPRSNFRLYAATAPVIELKNAGVTLGLGTDWAPSGSLTLLDEARCLSRYSRDSLHGRLGAADVHRMMTAGGARAVGLQGQVGALAPAEWADLVLLDTEGRRSLAEVLERSALPQIIAVAIGGRLASAPSSWAGRLPQLENCGVDPRRLCGTERLVCGVDGGRSLTALLQQAAYTIDDTRLCHPQPTDDCVARRSP